jgi:hypothetical protein
MLWVGQIANASFALDVSADAAAGTHIGAARIYVGGLQISRLSFELSVGSETDRAGDVTIDETRIKSAFASYASEDRPKVAQCIQGMLKLLPELKIFLDVVSLRSGERWEPRLTQEIRNSDIFYLFWSVAASRSIWVEREWRIALAAKGLDFIDPVPLEPPSKVPPPAELAALHFNDWTLPYSA